jgi:hypothetical protein
METHNASNNPKYRVVVIIWFCPNFRSSCDRIEPISCSRERHREFAHVESTEGTSTFHPEDPATLSYTTLLIRVRENCPKASIMVKPRSSNSHFSKSSLLILGRKKADPPPANPRAKRPLYRYRTALRSD